MSTIIILIWMHLVADFIFQTDKVATTKGKDNAVLSFHVMLYTLPFLVFGVEYAVLNGLLHFFVEWCSSRVGSYFWQKGDRHNFFLTIGVDQALHMTCLVGTAYYFGLI
jgi:hypothetical protein